MTNKTLELLPSLLRTAETDAYFNNQENVGMILSVDATVEAATAVLTPTLLAVNRDGSLHLIWTAAAAISAIGDFTYLFYPGAGVAALDFTEINPYPIPTRCLFRMLVADADAMTYGVTAHLIG